MSVIVGLDLETSGSEISCARPIQIGIAWGLSAASVSDIGWPELSEEWISPEALAVNKFTVERIRCGPPVTGVDIWLAECLRRELHTRGIRRRRSFIPVGFNVASFDMPFVRRDLPLVSEFFSRRSIDLNAVCLAESIRTGQRYDRFKKSLKKRAVALLGEDNMHDAGYDARLALACLHLLTGWTGTVTIQPGDGE